MTSRHWGASQAPPLRLGWIRSQVFNYKVMKFLVIFQKVIRLQNTWSFRKNESPFQEIILLEKLRLKNLSLVDQTHSTFKTCFWILSHIEYFKEFEVNQGVGLNLFPNSCVKIGSAKKFRCAVAFNLKLGSWRATFWFCIDVYPCLPQCVLVSIVWILRSFSKCRSFLRSLKRCRTFRQKMWPKWRVTVTRLCGKI